MTYKVFLGFLRQSSRTMGLISTLSEYEAVYSLTYLLNPWCRVLPEQLTGLQLVKKFPAFHGTRRFIIALTRVRHLSLSWASLIQSIYPHPTSWRFFVILSTHLRLGLPSGHFPSGFPIKTLYTPLSSTIRAACWSCIPTDKSLGLWPDAKDEYFAKLQCCIFM